MYDTYQSQVHEKLTDEIRNSLSDSTRKDTREKEITEISRDKFAV